MRRIIGNELGQSGAQVIKGRKISKNNEKMPFRISRKTLFLPG
jgi:hypothetical protein